MICLQKRKQRYKKQAPGPGGRHSHIKLRKTLHKTACETAFVYLQLAFLKIYKQIILL